MRNYVTPAAAGHETPDTVNHEPGQGGHCEYVQQAPKSQLRNTTINRHGNCPGPQNGEQPDANAVVHRLSGDHVV